MKIKAEWTKFKHGGVLYDFTGITNQEAKLVYETNPHLRFIFEEEKPLPIIETIKNKIKK